MEIDILDSLEDLCYNGPLLDENLLSDAIKNGANSIEYTQLVSYLTTELQTFCKLEENVNPIKSPEDTESFLLELSSFLKELGCPYQSLTEGPVKERLNSESSKTLLLDFLCCELQAARMNFVYHGDSSRVKVEINESPTAGDLKGMLLTLGFGKPPDNITSVQLFGKIESKLKELIGNQGDIIVGKPLFTGVLNQKQWLSLESLQKQMQDEYAIRREMLLKRLDITIQSFLWGENGKHFANNIAQVYRPKRDLLKKEPNVFLSDVLAAREDLAIEEKTSCATVRKNTGSKIQKIIIGSVPDRGGRPEDQLPPPPEMPSWTKRTEPPPGARGGYRGGGGGQGNYRGGGGGGGGGQGNYQGGGGGNYSNQGSYGDGHSNTGRDEGYQRGGGRGGGGRGRSSGRGGGGRGGQGYFHQDTYNAIDASGGFQPNQQSFQRTN